MVFREKNVRAAWFTGKHYFDMTEYFEWKEAREEKQARKLVKVG
jgi:hypothetical protein